MKKALSFVLIILGLLTFFKSNANELPPVLKDWQAWVQYKQEFRDCPSLSGDNNQPLEHYICAWPSVLNLKVSDSGAEFSQAWHVINETRIFLPGDTLHWPQQVTVNQQPVTILAYGNRPYVYLKKGQYQIKGQFNWNHRPESLPLPSGVMLVDLSVDDTPINFPKMSDGSLWLGSEKSETESQADFVKLYVNRLITDSHPMKMEVALELDVSGRAREEVIGKFNLDNKQLMAIESSLNTRVDSTGQLIMQLKPGEYQVALTFKLNDFPQELRLQTEGEHWPQQELWAFKANEKIRSLQIEGVEPIDAQQGFQPGWKQFPHFVVDKNSRFLFTERSRGLSHQYDSLSLRRQLWLSFDGEVFHFKDAIAGNKTKDWRVSTLPNYQLTQLTNHGIDRLITLDEQQRTGAEIRTPRIDINAGGKVKATQMQHASGWDISFANSQVELNIPPGFKLLNISGADNSYGDWVSKWHLMDLFMLLLTVVLVYRFFGFGVGITAAIALFLGYQESDMPSLLLLNLVVALGLVKLVKSPKATKAIQWYKVVSISFLLLVLLPFIAEQIRLSLYPQLEMSGSLIYRDNINQTALLKPSAQLSMMQDSSDVKLKRSRQSAESSDELQKITITGSRIQRRDLDTSYESGAIIQAGTGLPEWRWQKAGYSWNGPVKGDETLELFIISGWQLVGWRCALILFTLMWVGFMLKSSGKLFSGWRAAFKSSGTAPSSPVWVGMLCILLAALSLTAPEVKAQTIPNEQLLSELRERLYPKAFCAPDCVSISEAELRVTNSQLSLRMTYHNGAKTAGLLPHSQDWQIQQISLNGKPVKQLWRNRQGSWINLPQGISQVRVTALLKNKAELSLEFAERPLLFKSELNGWDIAGVAEQRLLGPQVQLIKKVTTQTSKDQSGAASSEAKEQSIASNFILRRDFWFANSWELTSSVERLAPLKGSINARIPLLSFEQPLMHHRLIKDSEMQVNLPAQADSFDWRSSVIQQESYELVASSQNHINEIWSFIVFPNWHIELQGIPQVKSETSDDDYWRYEYYPRAGEKLNFTLSKPPAASGSSVAIENVQQRLILSKRKLTNEIKLNYRATRSEQLIIDIGEAELKNLTHNGQPLNIGAVDNLVSINLKLGENQLAIVLEAPLSLSLISEVTTPKLNFAYSNLTSEVIVPENRWLLRASGPGIGPAFIYWGELLFFIGLAFGLSRLAFSPLNYWQWLALGFGMSTFSWGALAFVGAWLLSTQWRRQIPDYKQSLLQNWMVIASSVIAVFTLIAAVPSGLLQSPNMGVTGNGSSRYMMQWFMDHGEGALGLFNVISVPLWIYKGLMLVWATWLSFCLIKWISWIWQDLADAKLTTTKQAKAKLASPSADESKK
ncbi:hypothetical protein [Aliikangiella sp. IMCC44632]